MASFIEHHGERYKIGENFTLTGTVLAAKEDVVIGVDSNAQGKPPEYLRNKCQRETRGACPHCR